MARTRNEARPRTPYEATRSLRAAVRKFEAEQARWDQAREDYGQALAQANEVLAVRVIADEAGITFSRVAQIIRGAKGSGPGR